MKSSILVFLFLILIGQYSSQAQNQKAEVFSYVEQMPEFIAGADSLNRFIYCHLQYPKQAINQDIHGKVSVKFVVNSQGQISQLQVVKKVNPMLDSEAIRVVQLTEGLWKPGMQNGKAVDVYKVLPINFIIVVDTVKPIEKVEIIKNVEKNNFKMPLYKNDKNAVVKHIGKNIALTHDEIKNLFFTDFGFSCVVDTNGKCSNFKITKSVNPDFDKELLRVIRLMNNDWTPAMKDGKRIKYKQEYNIGFKNIFARNISQEQEKQYYLHEGKNLLKQKKVNRAIDYFVKSYNIDTTYTEALYYITLCVYEQGKIQDACKLIESLKRRNHPQAIFLQEKICAKKPDEMEK